MRGKSGTLGTNLVRVFLLQAIAISIAVVVGVFAAAKVVEHMLVNEALDGEAEHYWALYDEDPQFSRPNTLNLSGFLHHPEHGDQIPDWLIDLEPGFQRVKAVQGEPLVHVSDRGEARLYLVFDEIQVSRLGFFFGVAPLSLVLLLVYTLTYIGYRLSRSAVSPLVQLAAKVESIDARASELAIPDLEVKAPADSEVQILAATIREFMSRIAEFVQRERNFTRNASHELRTPLAVMRANLDSLERRTGNDADLAVPLDRMRRTVGDMEKLLETLLILAREDESRLPREGIIINDLLAERIEVLERAMGGKTANVQLTADCLLQLQAPTRVLAIIFDNIIRNAVHYSDNGTVSVHVADGTVEITDNGPGMDEQLLKHVFEPFQRGNSSEPGFGLGLAIVKRLCDRFGWTVDIATAVGQGTTVKILLQDAQIIGKKS